MCYMGVLYVSACHSVCPQKHFVVVSDMFTVVKHALRSSVQVGNPSYTECILCLSPYIVRQDLYNGRVCCQRGQNTLELSAEPRVVWSIFRD